MLICSRGVWFDRDKYPINHWGCMCHKLISSIHELNQILIQESKNINSVGYQSWHSTAYENQNKHWDYN